MSRIDRTPYARFTYAPANRAQKAPALTWREALAPLFNKLVPLAATVIAGLLLGGFLRGALALT